MSRIDEIEALLHRGNHVALAADGSITATPADYHAIQKSLLDARSKFDIAEAERSRLYSLINSPHTADFLEAVRLEAAHQRERWGASQDSGKADTDWFWLIGYLAGKALNKPEKQLHHIITTAAACLNWHAARTGADTGMRPGIESPEEVTHHAV